MKIERLGAFYSNGSAGEYHRMIISKVPRATNRCFPLFSGRLKGNARIPLSFNRQGVENR